MGDPEASSTKREKELGYVSAGIYGRVTHEQVLAVEDLMKKGLKVKSVLVIMDNGSSTQEVWVNKNGALDLK